MAKIAISLPDNVFHEIEAARRASGETRSGLVRRAVEALLRRQSERKTIGRYVRGYEKLPETADEIAIAQATTRPALADNPWDEEQQ